VCRITGDEHGALELQNAVDDVADLPDPADGMEPAPAFRTIDRAPTAGVANASAGTAPAADRLLLSRGQDLPFPFPH
jgi:hypothetical protein